MQNQHQKNKGETPNKWIIIHETEELYMSVYIVYRNKDHHRKIFPGKEQNA